MHGRRHKKPYHIPHLASYLQNLRLYTKQASVATSANRRGGFSETLHTRFMVDCENREGGSQTHPARLLPQQYSPPVGGSQGCKGPPLQGAAAYSNHKKERFRILIILRILRRRRCTRGRVHLAEASHIFTYLKKDTEKRRRSIASTNSDAWK